MDSGNSGSIHSSSGGEDEFDSQSDGISALLMNNNQSAHHFHHQQQPPPLVSEPETSSSYMYHNNYFNLVSVQPPPPPPPPQPLLIDSDANWLKALRSNTTFQSLLGSENQVDHENTRDAPPAIKNPRKRSRASRRAPTTVLTTDTSNFRAMVQEFTGIPAPPYASSPFLRNRGFDLFGGTRTSRASPSSHPQPQPSSSSSYLSKPFAQKVNFTGSSSSNSSPHYFNVSSFLEPNNTRFPTSTKTHQDIFPNDEYRCHVNTNTNTNTHSGGRPPNLIYSADQTTITIPDNNQDGFSCWQNNGVNLSQENHQNNFDFPS